MKQHLPIHPFTGLRAVYVTKNGTPRYPIMGGSEDGDAADSGSDSGDQGNADNGDDAGDDKGDDAAEASNRMLIDERNGRKTAETLLSELTGKSKSEIRRLLKDPDKARDALKPAPKADDDKGDAKPEVDADQIRREAEAKANARIVRAEVRALAAETFANPLDALHNLDLSDYEVNEDGELEDAAAVKAALADVLKKNPHYAKKGKAPRPDPSQGPRGNGKPDPGPGVPRIRAAYADSAK